ncbi:MAG TPA: alpha/beta hydrolase [Mycobacteriales bacterium]|nr:alpha/beta hydrolase [Mycobacteriales bacterium]
MVEVLESSSHGMPMYELRPAGYDGSRTVVYLHGGSYTFQIASVQWTFVARLARDSGARVLVPLYPLAPGSPAAQTVPTMTDLVAELIDGDGSKGLTLLGDSAGGGMALAVAQQLKARGKQPEHLVLLAPWLDVAMTDPALNAVEPHDYMLSIGGLRYCGRQWAGDLDLADPRVSPLHGDLTGLAPIDLFVGTRDMLVVDARTLAKKAAGLGATLRLHEGERMQHVYPMLWGPEAREARDEIAALVTGPCSK